ncbi:MAG: hypothetical protein JO170_14485 [Verrucomicrobia bacterium]|nr:hypothetical protein [Verrucomicrobiota bacterium]
MANHFQLEKEEHNPKRIGRKHLRLLEDKVTEAALMAEAIYERMEGRG